MERKHSRYGMKNARLAAVVLVVFCILCTLLIVIRASVCCVLQCFDNCTFCVALRCVFGVRGLCYPFQSNLAASPCLDDVVVVIVINQSATQSPQQRFPLVPPPILSRGKTRTRKAREVLPLLPKAKARHHSKLVSTQHNTKKHTNTTPIK